MDLVRSPTSSSAWLRLEAQREKNELGQVTAPCACRIWTSLNARRRRNSRERTKTRRWCNSMPRRRNCRPRHERADARHRVLYGMDEEYQCTTVAGGVDNEIGGPRFRWMCFVEVNCVGWLLDMTSQWLLWGGKHRSCWNDD